MHSRRLRSTNDRIGPRQGSNLRQNSVGRRARGSASAPEYLSALVPLLVFILHPSAFILADDWPTVQGNAQRTGFIREAVAPPYKLLWRVKLPGEVGPYTQPVISRGRVYLATLHNAVFALDTGTGKILWTFKANGPFMHAAAVQGERVFAASHDGHVYAISAEDGAELWRFKAGSGFWASPCLGDGKVLIGSRDGFFYAIEEVSGEKAWSYEVGEKILQTAAYKDGNVTFGAETGIVYMLDAATGKELWKTDPLPTISFRHTWPVLTDNAVMYTPIPVSNIGHKGYDRDARAVGLRERAPEDVRDLPSMDADPEVIRKYLDRNIDRQCVYLLDVRTGKLMSAAPAFMFMAVPQPPPVMAPDGRMFLAHSGWYWGETSPAFLAEMIITRDKTEVEDFLMGCRPGIISAFFPSDIRCQLTGSGHILYVSCSTSGAYNLDTDERIALPHAPRGAANGVSGYLNGIIPAEGKLFHISRDELFCQTTDTGGQK